jgi:heterodisulfide reductase subunit C2
MMQLIKLGLREEALSANAMWFCLTCAACSGRCPREIDIPRVMETIRHMAIEERVQTDNPHVNAIRKFHTIFLEMVKRYGRSYELRLMAEFNIRSGNLFKDVSLAPVALIKGKIPLLVKQVKNTKGIRKIFRNARKQETPHEPKP